MPKMRNCHHAVKIAHIRLKIMFKPLSRLTFRNPQTYISCSTTECHSEAPWFGKGVSKVVVSDGVTSIGNGAFYSMGSVTSIELPEGLQTIGSSAFEATNITSVNLPSTVTSLGTYAFAYTQLENINGIPEGVTELTFRSFCNTKLESLIVPESVTTVSADIFGGNDEWHSQALITNIYCAESIADQCARALQWKGDSAKVIPYQITSNGQVFYNNKWYDSANDILSNNYAKKRIYTIDEANKVSGRKNTFKIRYK